MFTNAYLSFFNTFYIDKSIQVRNKVNTRNKQQPPSFLSPNRHSFQSTSVSSFSKMSYDNQQQQQPYSKKLLLNYYSEALMNKFIVKRRNNFNSFRLNYKECVSNNNERLKMSRSTGSSFYKKTIKNNSIDTSKSNKCFKCVSHVTSPKSKIHFKHIVYNGKVNDGVNIKKKSYVLLKRKFDDGKEY